MSQSNRIDNEKNPSCWDCLVSILSSEKPTALSQSLRLTRIAEDIYRVHAEMQLGLKGRQSGS
jgi:hypothetical protein